jgi:hypothetical protein
MKISVSFLYLLLACAAMAQENTVSVTKIECASLPEALSDPSGGEALSLFQFIETRSEKQERLATIVSRTMAYSEKDKTPRALDGFGFAAKVTSLSETKDSIKIIADGVSAGIGVGTHELTIDLHKTSGLPWVKMKQYAVFHSKFEYAGKVTDESEIELGCKVSY